MIAFRYVKLRRILAGFLTIHRIFNGCLPQGVFDVVSNFEERRRYVTVSPSSDACHPLCAPSVDLSRRVDIRPQSYYWATRSPGYKRRAGVCTGGNERVIIENEACTGASPTSHFC